MSWFTSGVGCTTRVRIRFLVKLLKSGELCIGRYVTHSHSFQGKRMVLRAAYLSSPLRSVSNEVLVQTIPKGTSTFYGIESCFGYWKTAFLLLKIVVFFDICNSLMFNDLLTLFLLIVLSVVGEVFPHSF